MYNQLFSITIVNMPAVLTVENSTQRENFPLTITSVGCKKMNELNVAFLRFQG
jgi:hypothetical protein